MSFLRRPGFRQRAAITLVALLALPGAARRCYCKEHKRMEIHSTTFEPAGWTAAVGARALWEGGSPVVVLAREARGRLALSAAPLGAPARERPLALPTGRGDPIDWDAAMLPAGVALVRTNPGSASCPLAYAAGGEEKTLTGRYRAGVFLRPRFVKRSREAPPGVSALVNENGSEMGALFPPGDIPDRAYTPLACPVLGQMQDALLIQSGRDYLLLDKVQPAKPPVAGPPRRPSGKSGPALASKRDAAGNDVFAGQLSFTRVDAKGECHGPVVLPFGDQQIFEFDADLEDSTLAIVGTTRSGVIVALATLSDGQVRSASLPTPKDLSSPAIWLSKGAAQLVAIESPGGQVWKSSIRSGSSDPKSEDHRGEGR